MDYSDFGRFSWILGGFSWILDIFREFRGFLAKFRGFPPHIVRIRELNIICSYAFGNFADFGRIFVDFEMFFLTGLRKLDSLTLL